MSLQRFNTLQSLATEQGINLVTVADLAKFAKKYFSVKTENLKG